MISPSIADRVQKWDLSPTAPLTPLTTFGEIHKRIVFYYSTHYFQYLPTLSVLYPDFETRLANWLSNVPDDQNQRLLFELLPRLAFFSREDFEKLHQAAFDGPVARWIFESSRLSVSDPELDKKLSEQAHRHTWYCPLSDSLRINDFHNVNGIGGVDYRPDWRSLARFGSEAAILDFMKNHQDIQGPAPLTRLVILEDFIGSGSQSSDTVRFIQRISKKIPTLIVPLIVCPTGAQVWRAIESFPELTFSPVIELKESDMITAGTARDGSFAGRIADLAESTYAAVEGDRAASPRPYSAFGFPGHVNISLGTGSLVTLYSNTPANTLPLVQHSSNSWNAIFPRSARIR
ncbi:phosphoribosyltransferase-like protein [Anatilimnocola floriformis]|uniref:phosphoribosyltransferase-like protein n=1 Tax=Anatilimnocola floriformis TaxID=2948575 RepID=UPI0020C58283|nr:hypothetical protein [Anatilimnocola floriformis]